MVKMMRDETTLLVLMVRVDNEEKRNEWLESQKEE